MTTSPTATRPDTGAAHVSAVRLLGRTCAAEWSRLWTVKGTWWFLAAAAAVMVGIGAIAGNDAAGDPLQEQDAAAWEASSITALPGQFAILAIALTAVTADYATGGIVPTLQWTTRRGTLFVARTLVAVLSATVLGVLLALGSAVAAYLMARGSLTLPLDEGLDVLGDVALVFLGGAVLAVGLGFVLRNTAGGLVTVFLLMLVLPIILGNLGYDWATAIADVLPGTGAAFLLVGEVSDMTTASAVTTLFAWAGGALLLGWLRLLRTDANR